VVPNTPYTERPKQPISVNYHETHVTGGQFQCGVHSDSKPTHPALLCSSTTGSGMTTACRGRLQTSTSLCKIQRPFLQRGSVEIIRQRLSKRTVQEADNKIHDYLLADSLSKPKFMFRPICNITSISYAAEKLCLGLYLAVLHKIRVFFAYSYK
jgi:hypothetical protein